ncbi:hypothetical protein CPB84DRAFT_1847196 [Gymnopilus junonius]|uniref:HNH nuclease domain-containing protein n=1 Tax=Gymnopilus junonius TaxID=109634 RepID=A0A9P5NPI3_GYMJU|nr:hypothetical protein CPB84DRAFT_1847196 [Gymnopilus junonius]
MYSSSSGGSTDNSDGPPSTSVSEAAAIQEEGHISDGLKRRIIEATFDLSANRCLITNAREAVRYCHALSRMTPEHIIARLEYSWGIQYGQMNVDSSLNVFYLTSELHRSFHRGFWILMPEDIRFLDIYENHTIRGLHGNNFWSYCRQAGPYKYRLLASSYLSSETLTHHFMHNAQTGGNTRMQYEYPFHNFPVLTSHVHPRFAICHAGHVLSKRWPDFMSPHLGTRAQRTIMVILRIYKLWTTRIPQNAGNWFLQRISSTGQFQLEDGDSETSDRTRTRRYDWALDRREGGIHPPTSTLTSDSVLAFDLLNSQQGYEGISVSQWLNGIQSSPSEGPIHNGVEPHEEAVGRRQRNQ